jgi:hypothetical protein
MGMFCLWRLRRRRGPIAALAACLLLLALTVTGCATLEAAFKSSSALQAAGYQNVSVNVGSGSGIPAGGLVTVSYSSGPPGSSESDALGAEKIVWDTFPGRFGALEIVQVSGGCTGPFCSSRSNELAGATYAQLGAALGPRPHGLDHASAVTIPGWVVGLCVGLAIAVAIAVAVVITLLVRRSKRRRPPTPPPWYPPRYPPPGPPADWQGGGYPHQAP